MDVARGVAQDVWLSISKSTLHNYLLCTKKWLEYCFENNISYVAPSEVQLMGHIHYLRQGSQVRSIKSHLTAITCIWKMFGVKFTISETAKGQLRGIQKKN